MSDEINIVTAAVEGVVTGTVAPRSPNPAAEHRGPGRNALESIGMAVLMAVLLKYFVLEAYVIPTPSMQPTMMGSPEAGESDRILVDKLYYLLHEPKRWDIVVFRYPVRQVQSYVKRIVGVGGDRLKIAGGNLYHVAKADNSLTILRKPDNIQGTLWREIYPMRWRLERELANKDPDAIPTIDDVKTYFSARGGKWSVDTAGAFVGKPDSGKTLQLQLRAAANNNYDDGYDLHIAKILREGFTAARNVGPNAVQDLAIEFEITPDNTPEKLVVAIDIPMLGLVFSLEIVDGQGKLKAFRKSDKKTTESEAFPVVIPAGSATELRFERLDDRLIAYVGGDRMKSLDVDDIRVLDELEGMRVVPRITVTGKGSSKFAELRIERDLHYTRSYLAKDELIEVPEGHFFMMGDNTRGSADGRDWTAIEIAIDKDNNLVNPKTHPEARVVIGNKRPKPFENADKPHDDDNPVPMRYRDRIVFVDEMGEIRPLHGKVDAATWPSIGVGNKIEFQEHEPGEKAWSPEERPARFVPRRHIQGRPIARFLRSIGSFKIVGWIR